MTARKPLCRWHCKVNGCHRRGYTGPLGWLRHAYRFHPSVVRHG